MKNSQKIILAILAVALIGVGVFAFLTLNNTSDNNTDQNNNDTSSDTSIPVINDINNDIQDNNDSTDSTTPEPEPEIIVVSGDFDNLIGLGRNFQCSFSNFQNNSSNQGNVFVSRNRIRGDYTSTAQNSTRNVSMIRGGSLTYVWSGNQGYKLENIDVDGETVLSSEIDFEPIDSQDDIRYSCRDWVVDESIYNLPNGVNFTEITTSSKQAQNEIQSVLDNLKNEQIQNCQELAANDPEAPQQTLQTCLDGLD